MLLTKFLIRLKNTQKHFLENKMTDEQVETLKRIMKFSCVVWKPDAETTRAVVSIGESPEKKEGVKSDPVAFFSSFDHNDYAYLYNCELSEFYKLEPLLSERTG
jgi:hypothetical protein